MWQVYLLYHKDANRTYIGASTDVTRRLKEHNSGKGSKSTKIQLLKYESDWKLIAYLDGFINQSEAYRWEKLLKLHNKGLKARLEGFRLLSDGTFYRKGIEVSEDYYMPSVQLFEVVNG